LLTSSSARPPRKVSERGPFEGRAVHELTPADDSTPSDNYALRIVTPRGAGARCGPTRQAGVTPCPPSRTELWRHPESGLLKYRSTARCGRRLLCAVASGRSSGCWCAVWGQGSGSGRTGDEGCRSHRRRRRRGCRLDEAHTPLGGWGPGEGELAVTVALDGTTFPPISYE